jgi:hypothetical protein
MKSAIACAFILACIGFAAGAHKDVRKVKLGANADSASTAMTGAGYEETMLAMEARDQTHDLKMWKVGEGVLICTFTKADKIITQVSYFLCDERPKSARKEFVFSVKQFDPQSGVLEILPENKRVSRGAG